MRTTALFLLGVALLSACHHHDRRKDTPRDTPSYRSQDTESSRRSWPRHRETDDNFYRLHRQQGFLPPIGMRWDCPTEPQMLGYVTR